MICIQKRVCSTLESWLRCETSVSRISVQVPVLRATKSPCVHAGHQQGCQRRSQQVRKFFYVSDKQLVNELLALLVQTIS
jgi:hypothetical protein